MPHSLSVRRRQRADSDDEHRPSSSGSGKRQRNNGYARDSSPEDEDTNGSMPINESGYQPGSIVRVSLTNFVTYEKADFCPGPSLNMVIGPNGTGKSSLVCAICLGLGWPPSMLGRAEKFDDFIKHGKKEAEVEIELKGKSDADPNHFIKVQIAKNGKGGSRKWWINGRDATHNAVKDLTRDLSIQIDNLCQFLPQDKVSEFAAMTPKELLYSTQRAAAGPEMLVWQDNLIRIRKEQKAVQQRHDTDQESLKSNQKKRDDLQDDVEKLEDIEKSEKNLDRLRKGKPFIEYKTLRQRHKDLRVEQKELTRDHKRLQERVEPTMLATNEKEKYRDELNGVKNKRIQAVKKAERDITTVVEELGAAEDEIKQIEEAVRSERETDGSRKNKIQQLQKEVTQLEAKLKDPIEFDAADWNRRIREESDRGRALGNRIEDLQGEAENIRHESRPLREAMKDALSQMQRMDSQAGQLEEKLRKQSQDTATAWAWIKENQHQFEQPVHGPPLIECTIKDGCRQYLNMVEAFLNREIMVTFTTQTRNDYRKLIRVLREDLNLADISVRTSNYPLSSYQPPLDQHQMRNFGFEGFVRDFIDGPDPVVAMLCDTLKLHKTGVTLNDSVSNDQYNRLTAEDSPINTWVSGRTSYKVFRRREYGPSAVSTSANNVRPAQYWTNEAVNSNANQELQAKHDECKAKFDQHKARHEVLQQQIHDLSEQKKEIDARKKQLSDEKAELQRQHTQLASIPTRISNLRTQMQKRTQDGAESREKIQNLRFEMNEATYKKADIAFKYKDQVVKLRQSREALLEVEIRFLEAASDFDALTEENQEINNQLDEARARVEQIRNQVEEVKERAQQILKTVRAIEKAETDDETSAYLAGLASEDSNVTVEDLEHEIGAEQAFLDTNFAANPNARRDFNNFNDNIKKLEARLGESAEKLEKYAAEIAEIKDKWEPALDQLISQISDAFSYNFQQISCAGEVSIHKTDDFDEWSLEIKVKFREEGELQQLDSHVQSGGERSVSTIFYLMSLQSMARAPFRVVDEINQGMDPRNERMVHERMVDIACKEHTSQYFLITPKLLPNLRYDPRMRVLCIASGEYMPQNHETVSVSKAIAIKRALIAAN